MLVKDGQEIIKRDYDLSARNPNRINKIKCQDPEILIKNVLQKEKKIEEILKNLNKRF